MNTWVPRLGRAGLLHHGHDPGHDRSSAGRLTRTRSAPPPFRVPAKTSSPGAFATGNGSPVMLAWSTSLKPSSTAPSAPTRSPGCTNTTSPIRKAAVSTDSWLPPGRYPGDPVWSKLQQAADTVGGAFGGERLQRARRRENNHQQSAVEHLTDRRRPTAATTISWSTVRTRSRRPAAQHEPAVSRSPDSTPGSTGPSAAGISPPGRRAPPPLKAQSQEPPTRQADGRRVIPGIANLEARPCRR